MYTINVYTCIISERISDFEGDAMQKVNVKETRRNISRLLDEVQAGEEVIIVRRGKPVARLQQVDGKKSSSLRFPDHSDLRERLPPQTGSSAALIRELRDERG